MLVELHPDGSFERGKRLVQLSLDLSDLEFDLEQVTPGGDHAQEVNAGDIGPILAGGQAEHLASRGQIALAK